MAESRTESILVVRLTSFGDLVHTLPAVAALRSSFPQARLDWVAEEKWAPLVELCPAVDKVIPLHRSLRGYVRCLQELRRARYSCAIDFQGLYKSALLAWASGSARRVGFDRSGSHELGATWFYTERAGSGGGHAAERNLNLAVAAGVQRPQRMEFPLRVPESASRSVRERLAQGGIGHYLMMSPGGTWKSKCWPPERYGELCAEVWRRHGLRTVVSAGPGELGVAEAVARAAQPADPLVIAPSLAELAALVAEADVVVAADTGPMHLAAAMGARVVALFGPTDPARYGPLPRGTVVRGICAGSGGYKRSHAYSPEMLSVRVEEVVSAVEREIGVRA
jgi:lipopolysaccharide heptosyltransferase I